MAFEVDLEDLQKEESIDANRILNEYFNGKNINLKTQIDAPTEFTTLDTIIKNFNRLISFGESKRRFKETPKTLNLWIKLFKEYMVSNKRASRLEVAKVLIAMKEQEQSSRSILQRLTGMGKE